MLKKVVRQGACAPSFEEASKDLYELAELRISDSQVRRLSARIGKEWAEARDQDIEAFRAGQLPRRYAQPPRVAAVMLDGGMHQARAGGHGRGVHDPAWHDFKAACCLSLSSKERAADPQPEPPSKFLERARVARLAAQLKARGRPSAGRADKAAPKPKRPKRRRHPDRPRQLVRTVLASTADSEAFGWQVAAEVHGRGLDLAQRKACVCDGQRYNWAIYEMHLLPLGFVAVLDFLHLLVYLYAAAHAAEGKGTEAAWRLYEQWLRWAWGGQVQQLLGGLRAAAARVGAPAAGAAEDDPRQLVADAVTYVENNRGRMNYPRYRMLGLPISSAPVESVIKQINRRVKGTEKFWLGGGAEAMLQLRAAYLSEDGRWERYWARPRPNARAVGRGRLGRVA